MRPSSARPFSTRCDEMRSFHMTITRSGILTPRRRVYLCIFNPHERYMDLQVLSFIVHLLSCSPFIVFTQPLFHVKVPCCLVFRGISPSPSSFFASVLAVSDHYAQMIGFCPMKATSMPEHCIIKRWWVVCLICFSFVRRMFICLSRRY